MATICPAHWYCHGSDDFCRVETGRPSVSSGNERNRRTLAQMTNSKVRRRKWLEPRRHLTVAVEVEDEREEFVCEPRAKQELEEHHVGDVEDFLRNENIKTQRNADGEVQGKC